MKKVIALFLFLFLFNNLYAQSVDYFDAINDTIFAGQG